MKFVINFRVRRKGFRGWISNLTHWETVVDLDIDEPQLIGKISEAIDHVTDSLEAKQ